MASPLDDIRTLGDLTLFRTGMHFDTVVHCKNVRWALHKSILSSRCEWFKEKLEAAKPQDGRPAVIKLYGLQTDLVHTLLWFIYTAQLHHPDIKNHRVAAKLYNMSSHFKVPRLGEAVLAEIGRHAGFIVSTRRADGGAPRSFTKKQLDELVEAVRLAYNGDRVCQAPLRKLYMQLFLNCADSIRRDRYFYECMRVVPVFFIEMMEYGALGDAN
ncbi:hypothetical protein PG991_001198 [Apiospora marii]|uniref:BTB domain-containing protein n=1 Tax=Apiospora marii TaxID=335849 RepID=A0ABR1SUF5_9PEZI